MDIQEIGVILTFLVATLGLIVTIIGWSITARNQRKLLDRQIIAQREQQSRNLYLPSKIKELEELKTFLQTGLYIIGFRIARDYQKMEESISLWLSEFPRLAIKTSQLDIVLREFGVIQNDENITIYKTIESVTDLIKKLRTQVEEDSSIAQSEMTSILDGIVLSQKLIDNYIEIIAHGHRVENLEKK